ncbi:LOW QUALITY PROTEIN: hypothetical protein QC761_308555 [Podospora bellae-mahoneyi]|uniref:Uncharacterized protein n=1 Tax=Podospora bellae-mahoneyi TaxID=2093777 RepID=A0ABR0FLM7_9PEZI|nr:LOW QUALITY PROTEIN: hypothetical protein QC761_308555 [Podospora bellae-mahoneyi]
MWTPVYYTKDTWRWDTAGSVDSGLVGDGIPSWFRMRLECIADMSHEANWQLRFSCIPLIQEQHRLYPIRETISALPEAKHTATTGTIQHCSRKHPKFHLTSPTLLNPLQTTSIQADQLHLPLFLAKNSKGANARYQIIPRSPYA